MKRTIALAIAAAIMLAGCATGHRPAFFILQHADIDGAADPDLSSYGLLVCNPSIDPAEARKHAAPGAVLLAYVNAHMVPQYPSAFYVGLRAAIPEDAYVHDASGDRVSWRYGQQELSPSATTGDALARAVAGAYDPAWDGLYVDELWGSLPPWQSGQLGDALGIGLDVMAYRWSRHSEWFVAAIREQRPSWEIVANVGADAAGIAWLGLDGITIEASHVGSDALRAAAVAELARYDPALCVSWGWDAGDAARAGTVRQ